MTRPDCFNSLIALHPKFEPCASAEWGAKLVDKTSMDGTAWDIHNNPSAGACKQRRQIRVKVRFGNAMGSLYQCETRETWRQRSDIGRCVR
jgi:hypothetical protein